MGYRLSILKSRRGVWSCVMAMLILAVVGAVYLAGARERRRLHREANHLSHAPVLDAAQEGARLLNGLKLAQLWGEHAGDDRPQDWPQYRGPHRDGVVPGVDLLPDWSVRKPRQLWQRPCGGGYSSVIVSGRRAYLHDRPPGEARERILCCEADTGTEVWVHTYPADYTQLPGAGRESGPLATPTVHEGRLYAVGALGQFVCLTLDGPKVAWEHDLPREFEAELPVWGMACSPLIVGDLVIVQPGGRRGSIAAFDRLSGALRWSVLEDVSGYSSPVLAAPAGVRQIITLTQGRMVGLVPETGAYLWHYVWRESTTLPQVSGDYAFITCDHGSALVKLEAEGGSLLPKRVFECEGKLLASYISTPVLKDGYAYGFHGDVHSAHGAKLTCIDLRHPDASRWQTDKVVNGQLIRFGERILVQTQQGDLFLIDATPEGFRPLGEMQGVLTGGQAWAPPSAVGNHLYLRDHKTVVCLELPTRP